MLRHAALVALFAVFVVVPSRGQAFKGEGKILRSKLAGTWYPADPGRLRSEVRGYVDKAEGLGLDNVIALLLPHAGYRWSGAVAAAGIRQIQGKSYSRVIVIGPSHEAYMPNRISVPKATRIATPLGEIPLDLPFIKALREHRFTDSVPQAHAREHSVQIELPFLQYALKDFKLVPIVVGQLDPKTAAAVGETLAAMIDQGTLVVVSSDFTHYGRRFRYAPFQDNLRENIRKLDFGALEKVKKLDAPGFLNYVSETGATICGRCAIGVLLNMLPKDAKARLLSYDASGRMTGDFSDSVSYASVAFMGRWSESEGGNVEKASMSKPKEVDLKEESDLSVLPEKDRKALLTLARKAVEYYFKNKKQAVPRDLDVPITEPMKQVMGAFVTLHEKGRLRGCIGEIAPRRPLYEAVVDQAFNSAFRDYRFPAVTADELPELNFEISALTPPREVDSFEDIKIGEHGMTLSKHGRSAVFLPQVAPEQGWDLAQTLTHLAMKAGLPPDAWKEGAKFTVFKAIVFHE